jgi:hypothetical protein
MAEDQWYDLLEILYRRVHGGQGETSMAGAWKTST